MVTTVADNKPQDIFAGIFKKPKYDTSKVGLIAGEKGSIKDVAEKYGVSKYFVQQSRRLAREYGYRVKGDRLSDGEKQTIVDETYKGKSASEISQILGVSRSAVYCTRNNYGSGSEKVSTENLETKIRARNGNVIRIAAIRKVSRKAVGNGDETFGGYNVVDARNEAGDGNSSLLFYSDDKLQRLFPNTDPAEVRKYAAKYKSSGLSEDAILENFVGELKRELSRNIQSAIHQEGYDRDQRLKILRHSLNRIPHNDETFDMIRKEAESAIEKIEVATGVFKPVGASADSDRAKEEANEFFGKPGEQPLLVVPDAPGTPAEQYLPGAAAAVAAAAGARTSDPSASPIEDYGKKVDDFLDESRKRVDSSVKDYDNKMGASLKRAEVETFGVAEQVRGTHAQLKKLEEQHEAKLNGLTTMVNASSESLEEIRKTREAYHAELARTTNESNKRFAAMDAAANQLYITGKEMGGIGAQLKSEVDAAAESRKKLDSLAANYANAPEEARKLIAKTVEGVNQQIADATQKTVEGVNQQIADATQKTVEGAVMQLAEAGNKAKADLEARAAELTGGDPNAPDYTCTNLETNKKVEDDAKRARGYVSPWKRAGQLLAGAALLGALYLGITRPKPEHVVVSQPAPVIVQNNANLEARVTVVEGNVGELKREHENFVKKGDYDNDLKGLRGADSKNAADIQETGKNLMKMASDLYKFVPEQIKKFGESLNKQPVPAPVPTPVPTPTPEPGIKPIGPEPSPAPQPKVEEKKEISGNVKLSVEGLSGDVSGQQARAVGLFKVGEDYAFKLDALEKTEKHDLETGEDARKTTLWAMPELSITKENKEFNFKANLYQSREKMDGENSSVTDTVEAGLPVRTADSSSWEQDSRRTLSALSGDVKVGNLRLFGNVGEDKTSTTYKNDSDTVVTVGSMPPIVVNNNVKTTTNAATNFFTLGGGWDLGAVEVGALGRHRATDWDMKGELNGSKIIDEDGSSEQNTGGGYARFNFDNKVAGRAMLLSNSGDDLDSSQKLEGALHANVLLNDKFVLGLGGERSDGGAKGRGLFFWRLNDSKTGWQAIQETNEYMKSAEDERLFPETTASEQKRLMRMDRDMSAGTGGLLLSAEGGKEGFDKGDYWRIDAAAPIPFTNDKAYVYGAYQDGDSLRFVEGGVGYKPKKNFSLGWGFWSEENKETDTRTNATGPRIGIEW